jgi:hypothetical protein
MRRLARVDLLILDDGMMSELTATQRRDLMEIVDDRHDRGSIILASQIPLSSRHRAIGVSLIPRRYSTPLFTSPIGLNSRGTPCENRLVVHRPFRQRRRPCEVPATVESQVAGLMEMPVGFMNMCTQLLPVLWFTVTVSRHAPFSAIILVSAVPCISD